MATNRARALQVFDPVLSSIARSYRSHGFIARKLLPEIPVSTLSGQYPVFTKAFWFQNDVDNLSNDRAPAKEVDFEWSTETYLAREYALKVSITDLERQQAQQALRLEQSKTEFLTQRMDLAHEIRVAGILDDPNTGAATGQFTPGNSTNGTAWDGAGTPLTDIKAANLVVYNLTGQVPNTLVITYPIAYAMAVNAQVQALLRYDAAGKPRNFIEVGDAVLPATIHGLNVVIAQGAQMDSSNEGGASSISEIWGKHARVMYVDPNAGWGTPTCAYLMRHTGRRVTRWAETDPDIDYVREMERYDIKVVAPDTGYVIRSVIS